jgi:serine/threonine-protein kinase
MGVVVAAMQVDLERPVALKFVLPRLLERPDHVARFSREARAAAKLQSEHVARVLDVGALESGAAYIVMEYLEGEDLGRRIARQGPLSCAEAVGYILEASEAVAEAHACGIVHRDLKPANLFLANRSHGLPIIKVLDFGLSKVSSANEQITSESSILGSPLYMSPEQLLSARAAEPRSDIWSLGVALYQLLTARPAFAGDRMPELIASILHGREEPLESLRPDIPAGLRAAVHRCLEKDPANRFADIAQFAMALAPFARPSHQACVDRIAHVLRRPDETAGPDALASPLAETKLEVTAAASSLGAAESLNGSSKSITLPSPSSVVASGKEAAPPSEARKQRAVGAAVVAMAWVALGAAAIAIAAMSLTTRKSGDASSATGTALVPSPSAANALAPTERLPRAEESSEPPSAVEAPPAPPARASPAVAPASAAAAQKIAPQGRVNAPRVGAGTAAQAASRTAAAPSATAAPSASTDPLAKLKTQ